MVKVWIMMLKIIVLFIIILFILLIFSFFQKIKLSKNIKNKSKEGIIDLEKDPETDEYKPKK